MSFRLSEYERLLQIFKATKSRCTMTVAEAAERIESGATLGTAVILRHDVDRRPLFARRMAEREAANGVRSTYYFRCDQRGRFPEADVLAIAELGHEVGYHYECLSRARGDRAAALVAFRSNLSRFRRVASCISVAMHGAPLSRYHNQDLLVGMPLSDFGLSADAVLSFNHLVLAYLTDTGGRWQADQGLNLRDRVGRCPGPHPRPNDDSFAIWLAEFSHPVYVSTHPERWAWGTASFFEARLRDLAANGAKRLIRVARGPSGISRVGGKAN